MYSDGFCSFRKQKGMHLIVSINLVLYGIISPRQVYLTLQLWVMFFAKKWPSLSFFSNLMNQNLFILPDSYLLYLLISRNGTYNWLRWYPTWCNVVWWGWDVGYIFCICSSSRSLYPVLSLTLRRDFIYLCFAVHNLQGLWFCKESK